MGLLDATQQLAAMQGSVLRRLEVDTRALVPTG
jgi:hypothetical protein